MGERKKGETKMVKHKRVGLIVWGCIFILISIAGAIGILASPVDEPAAMLIVLPFFIGGVIMLAFGIRNAVLVTKNNSQVKANDDLYVTQCFRCGREIRAELKHFRPHGRYPEGFIYCPVCRTPISKRAFSVYRFENGTYVPVSVVQPLIPQQYNQPYAQQPYNPQPYNQQYNPQPYNQQNQQPPVNMR